jgi:hypothetical protein
MARKKYDSKEALAAEITAMRYEELMDVGMQLAFRAAVKEIHTAADFAALLHAWATEE